MYEATFKILSAILVIPDTDYYLYTSLQIIIFFGF